MSTALPKRLFELVEALQGRGVRTAPELAVQLGVSERTVRRDIGRLLDLDLPVETKPGRNGGVSLPAGALLPAVRFTDDELLALVVGLKATASDSDETLERAAGRALERLETVLSPGTRERLRALQEPLAPGQPEPDHAVPAPSQHVIALAEASHRGARVEIGYRSGDNITQRKIDPYGLAKIGPWYVVAYCHLRQDLRTFRIDRIRSITPTAETFPRPTGFDAYRHVGAGIAMLPGHGNIVCRALLKTDLHTASRQMSLATMLLEPVEDGVRLTVRTNTYGLEWVVHQLLRLRFEVKIEGPKELKDAATRLAGRLLAFGGE
ncbi:MAG TPA: transcriptional regulator [Trueperaceae bacterium]|nr:transcriptional regulator [Trueperaceae bacterium]